jgi:chorismate mutase / prephenate dehydratase
MARQPIAFLGPEGTFSHLVALSRFGAGREMVPCPDLAGVFDVLRQERRALAVVPIENSSGGTIYDTVDLLIAESGGISVREDLTLDVRLALLGHRGGKVREVFSHFAPLQHHRAWLQEYYPGARIRPVASTAVAAALAAKSRSAAALCAPGAAAMHSLDVLVFPVQPEAINVTRFYVVGRTPARLPDPLPANKLYKTTLVFRLKNRCGSLHSFLGPFSRAGVNLRMIVSRPLPGHPETYVFFCEVEGVESVEPLRGAMRKAEKFCESLQSLGSFAAGKKFAS